MFFSLFFFNFLFILFILFFLLLLQIYDKQLKMATEKHWYKQNLINGRISFMRFLFIFIYFISFSSTLTFVQISFLIKIRIKIKFNQSTERKRTLFPRRSNFLFIYLFPVLNLFFVLVYFVC